MKTSILTIHLKGNNSPYSKDVLNFILKERGVRQLNACGVVLSFKKYTKNDLQNKKIYEQFKEMGITTLPAGVFRGKIYNGPNQLKTLLMDIQPKFQQSPPRQPNGNEINNYPEQNYRNNNEWRLNNSDLANPNLDFTSGDYMDYINNLAMQGDMQEEDDENGANEELQKKIEQQAERRSRHNDQTRKNPEYIPRLRRNRSDEPQQQVPPARQSRRGRDTAPTPAPSRNDIATANDVQAQQLVDDHINNILKSASKGGDL